MGEGRELLKLLEDFADAFNRHDVARLLKMVTEDCVFLTSSGPDVFGERHVGIDALAIAFPRIWQTFPDARWEEASHTVCGARGFSEWLFSGRDISGRSVQMRGVDLFTFRDMKICRKDTFRKTVIS